MYSTTPLSSSMLAKKMHDYSREKAQARLVTAVADHPTTKEKGRFQLRSLFGRRPFTGQNKEVSVSPAG